MEVLEIKHDMLEAIGRKSREQKYWLALPVDGKEYPEASPRAKVLSAVAWVLFVLHRQDQCEDRPKQHAARKPGDHADQIRSGGHGRDARCSRKLVGKQWAECGSESLG